MALAAALILLASLVVGFVNGLLVTFFRINSFIATMGTGTLLYGVTNWYTNGEQIVGMSLPDSFTGLTQRSSTAFPSRRSMSRSLRWRCGS